MNTTTSGTNNIRLEVVDNGSVSSTSCNSITSDLDGLENDITEINIQKSVRKKSAPPAAAHQRKAKRVRFYRNGDKFFSGVVIPVMQERYR